MSHFNGSRTRAIQITEQTTSVLSFLGATIIILTFLSSHRFRKPINRLVFFAAWGNIMTNIATIISVNAITLGVRTPLCQFQGFIIQWFMPADALWAFAMACNVYLTFFKRYDAQDLRSLEWTYLVCCYGIPFVPAFVYLFIDSEERGKVYGSAVLWCWVSIEWDALRVAVFYGPAWLVILATLSIYVAAGKVIFRWRRRLLSFGQQDMYATTDVEVSGIRRRSCDPPQPLGSSHFSAAATASQSEDVKTAAQAVDKPLPLSPHRGSRRDTLLTSYQHPITEGANRAAINYCRTAALFFIALCITWIPSTINRVYTLIHPDALVFSLNFASGFVLPLQGFWNAVIYIATSWPACRATLQQINFCGRRATVRQVRNESGSLTLSKRPNPLLQAVQSISKVSRA